VNGEGPFTRIPRIQWAALGHFQTNGGRILARLLVRSSYMRLTFCTFRSSWKTRSGRPACFQGHRRVPVANRFTPKRSAKASASSGLEKQNTTKSLTSRRREYVGGDADKLAAKPRTTAPILLLVPQFSVHEIM
jgi:hypothetical protein